MPGARRRLIEPIPDALVKEALPPDTRDAHVAEMRRLLHVAMTRAREGLVLAYAAHTDSGALQPPSPFAEEAREALGAEWEDREEELFGPAESLHADLPALRDELLAAFRASARASASCASTPTSTSPTASCATSSCSSSRRCSARPRGPVGRRRAARHQRRDSCRPPRRSSARSSRPRRSTSAARRRARRARRAPRAVAARDEPSLEPFLPRRGDGLLLSASDIDTYRACPLNYKFARVFRIPSEPTLNQRFGILVHQVLERYHRGDDRARAVDELLGLLDAGWRRGGFGDSEEERQLRDKADAALRRYHERFRGRGRRAGLVRERLPVPHGPRTRCAAASTASTGCPTAATS